MKSKKIYDIIFYFNESQTLESRINYLKPVINNTIIFNFGNHYLNLENVIVIPVLDDFNTFKYKNFVELLFNFIGRQNIKSDDIFIFSKTFEIPTIESITKFLSSSSIGPTLMNQDLYYYSINLKSKYKIVGSCISTYTGLVIQTTPQNLVINQNTIHFYNKESLLEGGFSVLCYENGEKSLKSLQYWYPEIYTDITLEDLNKYKERKLSPNISLKSHSLEFAKNDKLSLFFNKKTDIPSNKKILLTFFYLKIDSNLYDEVYYLTDDNIKIDDIETIKIRKPKNLFYKSANYPSDFKLNEILTVLNTFVLHDEDEIHIKTKTVGDPTVFKYKDLKNSIPSDIIGTSSF